MHERLGKNQRGVNHANRFCDLPVERPAKYRVAKREERDYVKTEVLSGKRIYYNCKRTTTLYAWLGCPWPNGAWQAELSEYYNWNDINDLYDGAYQGWSDFTLCSDYFRTKRQALADLRSEIRTTRTF